MLKLIRNVEVYAPQRKGKNDILICGDKIAAIEPSIECNSPLLEIVDADGLIAIPGLIDQHVHIIGGGGESGFISRIDPLPIGDCIEAGVTTVVGLLGTDSTTKDVHSLVAYAKALNAAGITAYCLTGSYAYPSPTITGSVRDDIVYISEVIGVKLAISDHRSSYPSRDEILRIASQARIGGLLSNKPGFVHLHLGKEKRGLKDIFDIVTNTDMPISQFKPTHVGNQLKDAFEFAALGGYIDFSTGHDFEATAALIKQALENVDPKLVTLSTDANGSLPVWNNRSELVGMFKGKISSLLQTIRLLVLKQKVPLEDALALVTENVARGLMIYPQKGILATGSCADLILLDSSIEVHTVFAKGRELLSNGVLRLAPYYHQNL